MASYIKIKRSTGTVAPSSLQYGELAYTTGVGTHGNSGGRLFIGDNVPNAIAVGGRYYTDLLSIGPGLVGGQSNPTTPSNGFVAILDQNRKVDQWNVDNLTLDGNTLSSTDTDGDINIDPNGQGEIVIPDDTYLTFGSSKDTKIKYDETTDDRLEVTGADWDFANGVAITVSDVTSSISTSTGAFVVSGGVAIGENLNIGGNADFNGDLNLDGGDLTSNLSSFNIFPENVSTIDAFAAGETIGIGSDSATTTVTIRSTTNSTSTSTGALVVNGGVGIASDLNIGGVTNFESNVDIQDHLVVHDYLTVEGNTNLGDSSTDQVTIVGNLHQTGISTIVGELYVDAVGINSNTIFTRPGSGDKLFIDPFPDGLSNEGTVIIKGDLQVDGTTTTVNSVTVTSNNPIYVVGDNATTRTVMVTVAIGSSLSIDSVAGINTNDVVTGNNIPSNTVISSIDSGTKIITLSNAITGTVNAGDQLTISQGVDTNDDRGIAFKYISSGIGTEAVVKTGFFGYADSSSRWTYVPDAGIAGNVVTGTKGFLDIKGIYYQTGDYSLGGVSYFDANGLMTSTVSPGAGINTSNYILTTDEFGVPTWTDTIDGGMF